MPSYFSFPLESNHHQLEETTLITCQNICTQSIDIDCAWVCEEMWLTLSFIIHSISLEHSTQGGTINIYC